MAAVLRRVMSLVPRGSGEHRARPDEKPSISRRVAALVLPSTGDYALEGCSYIIPMLAASHYRAHDATEVAQRLGALGLGSSCLTCTALVVRTGWSGGQDSLVSQAFGRGDFKAARTYLHQCQIWMTGLALGCAGVLLYTEDLLAAVGVADSHVASLTSSMVFACLPGIWFDFQYEALDKFLMNQEVPTPSFLVSCIAVPMHFVWCRVLLLHSGLDAMTALGLAWSIKAMSQFFLLAAYITLYTPRPSCHRWWWPLHGDALSSKGLLDYAGLGLPSTAMYMLDWWSWEVLTLLAGSLGDGPELAAHVATAGASDWFFLIGRGAPKAVKVLVGEAFGRDDVEGMRAAVKACSTFAASLCACAVLAIWGCHWQVVAWLMPGQGAAQDSVSSLLPFVALQLVLDAANGICNGVMAGLGRQGYASAGMLLCSWVVQLPAAWYLAYTLGFGVRGLRMGVCVADVLGLTYNIVLLRLFLGPFRRHTPPSSGDIPVAEYGPLRRRALGDEQ